MVHTAVGFAKMANRRAGDGLHELDRARRDQHADRRRAGDDQPAARAAAAGRHLRDARPGAGAAAARATAARRTLSVNDCFKPVSRYWDRINRPEQLITALPEALRILTSPAETGAVTLCLPQDVQTEAFDYPEELFRRRVWTIARQRPDEELAARSRRAPASARMRRSSSPAAARSTARRPARWPDSPRATGIAVVETMAGKGALAVRSSAGARRGRRDRRARSEPAGPRGGRRRSTVGSRLSDFTTASKTAFQHPDVRFININVTEFDAGKHQALPLVGDARATLEELAAADGRMAHVRELPGARRTGKGGVGARGGSHSPHRVAGAQSGRGHRRFSTVCFRLGTSS